MIAARCMVETVRGDCAHNGLPPSWNRVCKHIPGVSLPSHERHIRQVPGVGESTWRAYCASVAPGYAYADVVDIGMSVFVVTNNEMELAEKPPKT